MIVNKPEYVRLWTETRLEGLQLWVKRPVSGRLTLRVGGSEYVSRRIESLPERRITLTLPAHGGLVDSFWSSDERPCNRPGGNLDPSPASE